MLKLTELQVSSRNHPIGLDEQPVFSWKMVSDIPDTIQTAYRVRVGSWDTGRVESGDSLFVPYAGPALQPRTAYRVQVEVWDNHGQTACAETGFETGLQGPDGFAAQWIADPFEGEHPLPVFETEFAIDTPVTTARLYITAHGIYEAELDGAKLGDAWFAPGWTSYHKRLQYQTIPVDTARLTPGRHTLRVTVANGWYKGALGFVPSPNHYGDRAALLAMLCLDGRTVATGEGWRVTTGPVQRAEFYYGEDYDAAAPAAAPRPPLLPGLDKQNLIAQEDEPVRCVQMLPVVKDFLVPNGEWVLDFGQNITGVVHAKLDLPAGAQVRLRHAESLDENGNFYTGNLSFAKSEDTFRSAGQPAEYLPRFTYHGFRYLCVEGLLESQRDPAAFTACVLTTDLRRTGQFRCSDERVNQLQSNIQWSQQDNFLEVPTDCPQRSERLGWTGDIRAYGCTALFNSDAALFLKKWLRDLAADQGEDGAVPYVVPDVLDAPGQPVSTASFWGDSAVVLPWEIYMASGDRAVLREQYPSMKAWVDYMTAQTGENGLWQTGFQYGDWLGLDAERTGLVDERVGATDPYLAANVSYADSTRLLARIAALLGYTEDAAHYNTLYDSILAAFRREYLTPTGRMVSETQTALTLALHFGMLPETQRQAAAVRLATSVEAHKNHIITGFVGTPFVCDVLSDNGRHDLAGKLLLQDDNPSWLYEVKMGATTIWERWDSILPDGSFNPANMNSLNHYAYGSIGSWMYRRLGGLEPLEPGYRRFRFQPQPVRGITWAECSLDSPYGIIRCAWRCENGRYTLDLTVPANTTAEVHLPEQAEVLTLGSGTHHWEYATATNLAAERYTMESTLRTVMDHPITRPILEQYAPEFLSNPMMEYVMNNTLNEMLAYAAQARPLFEMILKAMNESGM